MVRGIVLGWYQKLHLYLQQLREIMKEKEAVIGHQRCFYEVLSWKYLLCSEWWGFWYLWLYGGKKSDVLLPCVSAPDRDIPKYPTLPKYSSWKMNREMRRSCLSWYTFCLQRFKWTLDTLLCPPVSWFTFSRSVRVHQFLFAMTSEARCLHRESGKRRLSQNVSR
jgi:hypothetical protein